LDVGGALDRLDDARELGQEPVAHELHDAPAAPADLGLHQLLAQRHEALQRARLVGAHEARVANHVGGEYGSQPAFQSGSPSREETSRQGRQNP
jgi:hypothetical protein